MPIAAIYGSIFKYRQVRERLYPEWSDEADVLMVVDKGNWYPLTARQRKGLENYFTDIQNMQRTKLFAEMKSKEFEATHGKAIADWKAIWKILMQKSKFNTLFSMEIHSQELDAPKLYADWELAVETWQETETSDGPGEKPTAGSLLQPEKDCIHRWIFGEEGFNKKRMISLVNEKAWCFTEATYATAWDRDVKKRNTGAKRLQASMEEIDQFWNSWKDPTVMKLPSDLKKWLRLVERTKSLAVWMYATTTKNTLNEYLSDVNHILASKDDVLFQKVGLCTLPPNQIRRMAAMINEDEFQAMSIIWGQVLSQDPEKQPMHTIPSAPDQLIQQFLKTTMGVENQIGMSSEELLISMGAVASLDGRFHVLASLNCTMPKQGWYTWDLAGHERSESFQAQIDANEKRMKGLPSAVADFIPLDLRWHQLCGIHAMLTHISTFQDDARVDGQPHSRRGLLISDEVGVGKTAQIIGFLSQLMHWKHLENKGKGLPPLHRATGGVGHFIFGEFLIPDAPHIIVTPVSLIPHWEMEIKTWMGRHAEVFLYTGSYGTHKQFFSPTGLFQQSKQPHHYRKIVLVSSTALASDVKALVDMTKETPTKGIARKLSSSDPEDEHTLLHQQELGVVVVDEAHEHRTGGARFEGLLLLRDNATVVISATATPLYTGSRDLRNIGRINNLAEFMTEDAEISESSAARVTARVRKLQNQLKERREEDAEEAASELRENLADMLLDVSKIRQAFGSTIIRRELSSKGEDGVSTITGMKSFWHQKAFLKLSQGESDHIKEIEELLSRDVDVKEDIDSISLLFQSSGFYLRLRQASINSACVHASLSGQRLPRVYTSADDFAARGSTKEKAVIKIIKHHMPLQNRQQNPLSWTKEGAMSIETRACEPPEVSRHGCTKFVVYTEFTSLMKYLQSALDHHELPYLVLTGDSGNSKKRAEIIEHFQREEDCPILLLSNVGKVGINLSAANILIVMDPLFSNQEFRQIVGRVWRYPQDRQVIVYQLVALGTADATLQDIADNKDTLLNAFNSTNSATTKGKMQSQAYYLSDHVHAAILRGILGETIDEVADAMEDTDKDDEMARAIEDPELSRDMTPEEQENTRPNKRKPLKSKAGKRSKDTKLPVTSGISTAASLTEKVKGKSVPSLQVNYGRRGKEKANDVGSHALTNENSRDMQITTAKANVTPIMEGEPSEASKLMLMDDDDEELWESTLLDMEILEPTFDPTGEFWDEEEYIANVAREEHEGSDGGSPSHDSQHSSISGEGQEGLDGGSPSHHSQRSSISGEEPEGLDDDSPSHHSQHSLISSGDEELEPPKSAYESEHSEHTSEIEQVDGLQPLQSATLDDAAIGETPEEYEPSKEIPQGDIVAGSQSGTMAHFILSHTPISQVKPTVKCPRYVYSDGNSQDEDEPRPKRGRLTVKRQKARDTALQQLKERRHPEERSSPSTSADESPAPQRVVKTMAMKLSHSGISGQHRKSGPKF